MITYQSQYTRFTTITKDTSTAGIALGKQLINEKNQEILSLRNWWFMEKDKTMASVASQEAYDIPGESQNLLGFWTVYGGTTYYPQEIFDLETWHSINATATTSDITSYFIVLDNQIHLYPAPVSTGVTLHFFIRRIGQEMSVDDYTTGTISTTAGSTAVTGALTVFTSAMVGRFIKVAGLWYEIETFTGVGSIATARPIANTVVGATYSIGEASLIPQEFHDMIWKGAVSDYFDFKGERNPWEKKYTERLIMLIKRYGSGGNKTNSQVMVRTQTGVNPNDYPEGLHV
jgi:hypothetical protein